MWNGRPPIAGTTSAALSSNYTVLSKEQIVQCSVQSCMKLALSVVYSQCWRIVSVLHAHTWTIFCRASCCSVETVRVSSEVLYLPTLPGFIIGLYCSLHNIDFFRQVMCPGVCVLLCTAHRISNFHTELSSSKLSQTYLLTPWSSALLENLTGSQLVKKFPAVYVTRRFITAFVMPATCPYPEPDQSRPCPSVPLPEDPS
jgi:hypothetical protein